MSGNDDPQPRSTKAGDKGATEGQVCSTTTEDNGGATETNEELPVDIINGANQLDASKGLLEDKAQGGQMLRTAFPTVRVAAVVLEESSYTLLRAPQVSNGRSCRTGCSLGCSR